MARKSPIDIKAVDEVHQVRCRSGASGILRQEIYQDEKGRITKYNLAFIHFGLCQADNGRVLGYDNAHGFHERHWMGTASRIEGRTGYEQIEETFFAEVAELKEKS